MSAIVEFETIPQLFRNLFRFYDGSDKPALRYKDRLTKQWTPITWDEFERLGQAMAGYLHKKGIRPGDRVAILSENRPEWVITDLATQFLGAVNVSLYTSLPASQVGFILADSGAKVFITSTSIQLRKAEQVFDDCEALEHVITMSEMRGEHPDYVVGWDAALAEGEAYWNEREAELTKLGDQVTPDDLCALIYTSGTTGQPKGVMLTHHNFVSNTRSALNLVPFGPDDHHLSFLPLCHSFERTAGYTAVMACGATTSYAESIDTVAANLLEVSPTVMISVPRLFEKIYNAIRKSVDEGSAVKKQIFTWAVGVGSRVAATRKKGKNPGPVLSAQHALAHRLVFSKLHEKLGGNLRFAVSGGAALPKTIGEFFEAAGITIIEGYGLTETAPVLTVSPMNNVRYGSVGHVIPGVTVAIQSLDDRRIIGKLSGDDYPSDLTTSEGEIIARGPNIMKGYWNNDESTREAIDSDGWYHTGDVGRFDNGYLIITDRIKHMIVSRGGKNIYPGPIEEQFKTVQYIEQIVILGEGREFLTALVVPNLDNLRAFAKDQGIDAADDHALLTHEAVRAIFDKEFRTYSRGAAAHEKVRAFRLIEDPFTVDNELLTPTMKPRRKAIEKEYAALIDEMYTSFGER
jgi:long-chain acyl-CoA synthetase